MVWVHCPFSFAYMLKIQSENWALCHYQDKQNMIQRAVIFYKFQQQLRGPNFTFEVEVRLHKRNQHDQLPGIGLVTGFVLPHPETIRIFSNTVTVLS